MTASAALLITISGATLIAATIIFLYWAISTHFATRKLINDRIDHGLRRQRTNGFEPAQALAHFAAANRAAFHRQAIIKEHHSELQGTA